MGKRAKLVAEASNVLPSLLSLPVKTETHKT